MNKKVENKEEIKDNKTDNSKVVKKETKNNKTDDAKVVKKVEPSKAEKSSGKVSSFKKKKKVKRNITSGIAFVYSTFNNTIISIADESGNVIAWSSAGAKGFKGSRKSTPYAAQVAADDAGGKAYEQGLRNLVVEVKGPGSGRETALRAFQSKGFKGSRKSTPYAAQVAADDAGGKAYEQGLRTLTVEVKGPGSGRETALRAFQSKGFKITSIKDTTPMPHNGTRPPKRRRV